MEKNDNKEIQFVLKEIKKLINIDLKLSESFPGIYETKNSKKKYFNIETEKRFFEDDLYPKLLSLVDKHIISDVQPNGLKILAIFYKQNQIKKMNNLKTLGIIILDEIGYTLIMNSLSLNILFNNEQLKNFKVGYNLIKIDNEDKLLNNLQKFTKIYDNKHIIYFELNSIFKNRKKDNELLPKENKKIIFLYKDVDIINLFVGDWIPYGVIRNENLFYELNEFGIGGMFPANGYLGSVNCLSNNIEISFNV